MDAYSEYLLRLANSRLDELRQEAAHQRLVRSVDQRPARRWRPWRTRQAAPRPPIPLPVRAERAAPGDVRRSA